jgi:hypothetical protein
LSIDAFHRDLPEKIPVADLSLIWGSLRNLIDFDTIEVQADIALIGTTLGIFPVESFHPIFLEVPRNLRKSDLSGRSNYNSPKKANRVDWHPTRVVSIPIYKAASENMNFACFKSLIESWHDSLIPEDIPSLALAINTTGSYCDVREQQHVVVLLIWSDSTARILELDWFEGPLEDCITPEWYISSSKWLRLDTAFMKLKNIYSRPISLKNPCFSIFMSPSSLGSELQGEKSKTNCKCWQYEWIYRNQADLINDIEAIFRNIEQFWVI